MVTKAVDREELRALRGTKRTCQNTDCGSPFYDLARDPITCPICSTVYELARQVPQATQAPQKKVARPAAPKKFDIEEVKPAAPEDELAAVEDAEDDPVEELRFGGHVGSSIASARARPCSRAPARGTGRSAGPRRRR